ncbi:MAG TPA: nucleoside triphosphate pyrophosphohydrolase, partial [Mycobacterium sp.]|nr:nucleoside triphosphate pyrophosphohydrolase [Mycobacterium sp.]
TAVLEFMDTVRSTEKALTAGRRGRDIPEALDAAPLGAVTEEEWRAYWPQLTDQSVAAPEDLATHEEPFDELLNDYATSDDEHVDEIAEASAE